MRGLSVIVPVYNVERYIHQCLDSLVAQDYENLEILLIDDGSPDRCGEICDDYAKKDDRIRVIHQENQGLAEVRNIGIREAKGEYIGFVDSDDYIQPGMFSKMMECIEKDPATDIVVCDYTTFDDNDCEKQTLHPQKIHGSAEMIRDEFLMDHYPSHMPTKIWHKNLFEGVIIPKGIVFEDLYVVAGLVAKARKIAYVPESFYCYRQHASSFTMTPKVEKKWGWYKAWRERERICEVYGYTRPLNHVRMQAENAAISLKMMDLAAHFLSKEEVAGLDEYIQKIEKDTSRLSRKRKRELWALCHLPRWACALIGQTNIWGDEHKRKKLSKRMGK